MPSPHEAAAALQAWYRRHALPPATHRIYTHGWPSLHLWRRTYVARYPDPYLHALVALIPRKLRRPELACTDGSPPRRHLRRQLSRMSVRDLATVGW